jgi:asparagine synthetase B (glutamine-hydrolysing)
MCGIVGIVKLDPRETVDEARLKRMRDVRHRGPDDEGLWIEGPVGLGMRRFSIVDVAGGHQSMANEDDTVWILYNGETAGCGATAQRVANAIARGWRGWSRPVSSGIPMAAGS